MKYQCPKCKVVIESSRKLEYCVCGGKYIIPFSGDAIREMFGDLKMFGGSETLADFLRRKVE